jgi:chemotaxis protein MotB
MPRRRGNLEALNPWPGYVDALSTLLMVIIFVLLVFVLAQAFLSVTLSGRDQALERLNHQMAQLSDMLALERGRSADLRQSIARLNMDLQATTQERDALTQQLTSLRAEQARVGAERDTLKSERDRLQARLADEDLQSQAAASRGTLLQAQLADAARRADAAGQAEAATAAELADAQRQLAEMRRQAAELDRTVQADRDTITARLSDLAKLEDQVRALTALRDQLERQAQDAAVRATTEQQRRAAVEVELADERKLSDSQKAQLAGMARDLADLQRNLASVKAALDISQASSRDKDVQIANLGQKLNAALAQKVQELQRYRSDFFGKLREVLANRPGIQVVGDRFVFQSEVLFPSGSDQLSPAGRDQITELAKTFEGIAKDIPSDVNWLLRVDGHADKQKVDPLGPFVDNWDLSAKRAIRVVQLLIEAGIPANRLAATAFGDNQPLDPADTPDAYRKNRRIEIRLTDR